MKYQVGIILDSVQAFDLFHDATGRAPARVPEGKNTNIQPFRLIDENGVERAAILINQTGFGQTAMEEMSGEEVNGLSVAIAIDAPADEGAKLLEDYVDHELFHAENGVHVTNAVDHRRDQA